MNIKNMKLNLIDYKEAIVSDKRLISIPLREEIIIAKSIEFFNDPEPCMIHRSAVMTKMYNELFNYFTGIIESGRSEMLWNEIPSYFKCYFNYKEDLQKIIISIN